MEFRAAGEIIGVAHQVRTVELKDNPHLPDGTYRFIDMYCVDPSCNCKKTMIQVYRNKVHVSTINYGWKLESSCRAWLGFSAYDIADSVLNAPAIDITSPNKVSPGAMLDFFKSLLDEQWVAKFKIHYAAVKLKLSLAEPAAEKKIRSKRSK